MRRLAVVLLFVVLSCDSDPQREKDLRTIEALKAHGTDLTKPHRIEHHIYAYSREDAEAIAAWGRTSGFEVSEFVPGRQDGVEYLRFDLVKPTVPEIDTIHADSSRMARVAEEHRADYDGWGCSIVR